MKFDWTRRVNASGYIGLRSGQDYPLASAHIYPHSPNRRCEMDVYHRSGNDLYARVSIDSVDEEHIKEIAELILSGIS